MAVKRKQKTEGEMNDINVTSLIDVLFVLLIVFMISASAVVQSSIHIKLPDAVTQEKAIPAEIEILISPDGRTFVGNRELDINNLETYLRRMANQKQTNKVIIKADTDTDYGKVMSVMDKARIAGLDSLSLAVEGKESD